jgi:hypothetical protein
VEHFGHRHVNAGLRRNLLAKSAAQCCACGKPAGDAPDKTHRFAKNRSKSRSDTAGKTDNLKKSPNFDVLNAAFTSAPHNGWRRKTQIQAKSKSIRATFPRWTGAKLKRQSRPMH